MSYFESDVAVDAQDWSHVAVTVNTNDKTVSFYINSKPAGTYSLNSELGALISSGRIFIGRDQSSLNKFVGKLDDLRLFDRALDKSDIHSIYMAANDAHLLGKYDFESVDTSASIVHDTSLHGQHAELVNYTDDANIFTSDAASGTTAFQSDVDTYLQVSNAPWNGSMLNNSTFAAWIKLEHYDSQFEPIINKPGVFDFGIHNGRVCLRLGDGQSFHALPLESGYQQSNASISVVSGSERTLYRSVTWEIYEDPANKYPFYIFDYDGVYNKSFCMGCVHPSISILDGGETVSIRDWGTSLSGKHVVMSAGGGLESPWPTWLVGGSATQQYTFTMRFQMPPSSVFGITVTLGSGHGETSGDQFVGVSVYTDGADSKVQLSIKENPSDSVQIYNYQSPIVGSINTSGWNQLIMCSISGITVVYLNTVKVCEADRYVLLPAYQTTIRIGPSAHCPSACIPGVDLKRKGCIIGRIELLDRILNDTEVRNYTAGEYAHRSVDGATLLGRYEFNDPNAINTNTAITDVQLNMEILSDDPKLVSGAREQDSTAFAIDGGSYLRMSDIYAPAGISFGAWIQKQGGQDGKRTVVSHVDSSGVRGYQIRIREDGRLEFYVQPPTVSAQVIRFNALLNVDRISIATPYSVTVDGVVEGLYGGTVYVFLSNSLYPYSVANDNLLAFVGSIDADSVTAHKISIETDPVEIDVTLERIYTLDDNGVYNDDTIPIDGLKDIFAVMVLVSSTGKYSPFVNCVPARLPDTKTTAIQLADGSMYPVSTKPADNDDTTEWYLIHNYLHVAGAVRTNTPRGMMGDSAVGFPIERIRYDDAVLTMMDPSLIGSEDYVSDPRALRKGGAWGHANADLVNGLLAHIGASRGGVELWYRGKTASHNREIDFRTMWHPLVDALSGVLSINWPSVIPDTYELRNGHSATLPNNVTQFDVNMVTPFYSADSAVIHGENGNWVVDELTGNASTFTQIWIRGLKSTRGSPRSARPKLLSHNQSHNALVNSDIRFSGETRHSLILSNGDIVEAIGLTSGNANNLYDNSTTSLCIGSQGGNWKTSYIFQSPVVITGVGLYQSNEAKLKSINVYYSMGESDLEVIEDWLPACDVIVVSSHEMTVFKSFAPVFARRLLLVFSSDGNTSVGMNQLQIYGYSKDGEGVISDESDRNSASRLVSGAIVSKPLQMSYLEMNNSYRTLLSKVVPITGTAFIARCMISNGDNIVYTCKEGSDAINAFAEETLLSTSISDWIFPVAGNGLLIYNFANEISHKIRGVCVWGARSVSTDALIANVKVWDPVDGRIITSSKIMSLQTGDSYTIEFPNEVTLASIGIAFIVDGANANDIGISRMKILGKRETDQLYTSSMRAIDMTATRDINGVHVHLKYKCPIPSPTLFATAYAYPYSSVSTVEKADAVVMDADFSYSGEICDGLLTLMSARNTDGSRKNILYSSYITVVAGFEDPVTGIRREFVPQFITSNLNKPEGVITNVQFSSFSRSLNVTFGVSSSTARVTKYYIAAFAADYRKSDETAVIGSIISSTNNGAVLTELLGVDGQGISRYNSEEYNVQLTMAMERLTGPVIPIDEREFFVAIVIEDSNGVMSLVYHDHSILHEYVAKDVVYTVGQMTPVFTNSVKQLYTWKQSHPDLILRQIITGEEHAIIWCERNLDSAKNVTIDEIWVYGQNNTSQLGVPQEFLQEPVYSTTLNSYLRENGRRVVSIASGGGRTMYILDDGLVYGHGNGALYALGNGKQQVVTSIEKCEIINAHCRKYNARVKKIVCCGSTTIVLLDDGTVSACGANNNDCMGTGSTVGSTAYTLIRCTAINSLVAYGYTVNDMISKNSGVAYRVTNPTGTTEWWGSGLHIPDQSNTDIFRLAHLDTIASQLSGDYIVASGGGTASNMLVLDIVGQNVYMFGNWTSAGLGNYIDWTVVDMSEYDNMNVLYEKTDICTFTNAFVVSGYNVAKKQIRKVVSYNKLVKRDLINTRILSAEITSVGIVHSDGTISVPPFYGSPILYYAVVTGDSTLNAETFQSLINAGHREGVVYGEIPVGQTIFPWSGTFNMIVNSDGTVYNPKTQSNLRVLLYTIADGAPVFSEYAFVNSVVDGGATLHREPTISNFAVLRMNDTFKTNLSISTPLMQGGTYYVFATKENEVDMVQYISANYGQVAANGILEANGSVHLEIVIDKVSDLEGNYVSVRDVQGFTVWVFVTTANSSVSTTSSFVVKPFHLESWVSFEPAIFHPLEEKVEVSLNIACGEYQLNRYAAAIVTGPIDYTNLSGSMYSGLLVNTDIPYSRNTKTLCAWAKYDESMVDDIAMVSLSNDSGFYDIALILSSNGYIILRYTLESISYDVVSPTSISTAEWSFVVATLDAGGIKIYVNNLEVVNSVGSIELAIATNSPVYEADSIYVHSARMYDTALSANEQMYLYILGNTYWDENFSTHISSSVVRGDIHVLPTSSIPLTLRFTTLFQSETQITSWEENYQLVLILYDVNGKSSVYITKVLENSSELPVVNTQIAFNVMNNVMSTPQNAGVQIKASLLGGTHDTTIYAVASVDSNYNVDTLISDIESNTLPLYVHKSDVPAGTDTTFQWNTQYVRNSDGAPVTVYGASVLYPVIYIENSKNVKGFVYGSRTVLENVDLSKPFAAITGVEYVNDMGLFVKTSIGGTDTSVIGYGVYVYKYEDNTNIQSPDNSELNLVQVDANTIRTDSTVFLEAYDINGNLVSINYNTTGITVRVYVTDGVSTEYTELTWDGVDVVTDVEVKLIENDQEVLITPNVYSPSDKLWAMITSTSITDKRWLLEAFEYGVLNGVAKEIVGTPFVLNKVLDTSMGFTTAGSNVSIIQEQTLDSTFLNYSSTSALSYTDGLLTSYSRSHTISKRVYTLPLYVECKLKSTSGDTTILVTTDDIDTFSTTVQNSLVWGTGSWGTNRYKYVLPEKASLSDEPVDTSAGTLTKFALYIDDSQVIMYQNDGDEKYRFARSLYPSFWESVESSGGYVHVGTWNYKSGIYAEYKTGNSLPWVTPDYNTLNFTTELFNVGTVGNCYVHILSSAEELHREILLKNVAHTLVSKEVIRHAPTIELSATRYFQNEYLDIDTLKCWYPGHTISENPTYYSYALKTDELGSVILDDGIHKQEMPVLYLYSGDTLTLRPEGIVDSVWLVFNVDDIPENVALPDVKNNGQFTNPLYYTFMNAGTFYYRVGETSSRIEVRNSIDTSATVLKLCVIKVCPFEPSVRSIGVRVSNDMYIIKDGDADETPNTDIHVYVGDKMYFDIDTPGHPFWISTILGNPYMNTASNVVNNGSHSGTITWVPTTAGEYYYQCSFHNAMYGRIVVKERTSETNITSDDILNVINTQTVDPYVIKTFNGLQAGKLLDLSGTSVRFTKGFDNISGAYSSISNKDDLVVVGVAQMHNGHKTIKIVYSNQIKLPEVLDGVEISVVNVKSSEFTIKWVDRADYKDIVFSYDVKIKSVDDDEYVKVVSVVPLYDGKSINLKINNLMYDTLYIVQVTSRTNGYNTNDPVSTMEQRTQVASDISINLVTNMPDNKIMIDWSLDLMGNTFLSYIFQYKLVEESDDMYVTSDTILDMSIISYVFTGMSHETTYMLRLVVETNAGTFYNTVQHTTPAQILTVPGTYTWISPRTATISVKLQGGDGGDYIWNGVTKAGGHGGYIAVNLDVQSGVEYSLVVAGHGENQNETTYGIRERHGGGGGGASGFKAVDDVNWMVIAGGGGGGADTGGGGDGGIPFVWNGSNGSGSGFAKGATITAVGDGGYGRYRGKLGAGYNGGNAYTEKVSDVLGGIGIGKGGKGGIGGEDYAGGGGGGGWFGGGGGAVNSYGHGGGGGGGSTYYDEFHNITISENAVPVSNDGNGYIEISYVA